MTASISDFNRFILPFVHDCSAIAAEVAGRFACIEFCERSDWLQYEADPITIQAGVAAYEVECPQDNLSNRVIQLTMAGVRTPLVPKTQDELTSMYGDWRAQEGTPRFFTQINTNEVILVPSPTERIVQGLRMLISIRPTPDAQEVDDDLYNRYAETIGYGARARLKEMAGQPYYDPTGAKQCWDKFYEGVAKAKGERMRDLTRAIQTVQMRTF